ATAPTAPAAPQPAAAPARTHRVARGETLTAIARRYGTSIGAIAAANGLSNPSFIRSGQALTIPAAPASATAPTAPAAPQPAAAPARTHRVARGETLTAIARRYGTSIGAIAAANGLSNPSFIRSGQALTIPAAPASATAPTAPAAPQPAAAPARTHRVARGETLTWIARRYGTSIGAIAAANGLSNPSFIRTGQVLTIPGSAAAAAPAAPAAPAAQAAPAGMPASMAALVSKRQAVRDLIVAEAGRQGVPAAFALAVAWQESGWQQGVVSSAGAIGIMQIIPASGEWVGQAMLGERVNLHDAASNVRAGVRLLRHYLDRYGDRSLALAAYYQGQSAVDRHGIYSVSRPYIASILRLEQIFAR
ncbi:MAG TPA: LysM peptidoglycan-binding domain-containing protein, partial [Candidatus Limnocylindria bacterium]|nr:LysM peptidoglycan-binding domain-containing protein [Candidatus Limnocylindria bacterium]